MSYTDYDFPHTHMYDSDLRELIANMRKLEEVVRAFVATNSVELADPIQWNIASQYAKNNIVLDNVGNAYLSKQPVPAGIELDNEEYWLEIFNYTQYVKSFNSNLTYNIEENTTRASKDYAVGDWLVLDDLLYKVIAAIEEDELFVVDTNIQRFTVEEFCRAWVDYANGLIQQYKDDIDASELAYRQQLAQDIADTTASLQAQLNLAISGVTVDSEVINARLGVDGVTYSTLGDAIRTQVGKAYNTIADLNVTPLASALNIYSGLIASDGTWGYIGSSSRHYSLIPVKGGEEISITNPTGGSSGIAALKTYTTPNTGDSADFSTDGDYNHLITIGTSSSVRTFKGTLPSDARYVYVYLGTTSDYERKPTTCIIGGYDYSLSLLDNIRDIENYVEDVKTTLYDTGAIDLTNKEYLHIGYINNDTNTWASTSSPTLRHSITPLKAGDMVRIIANHNNDAGYAILKSYSDPVNGESPDFSTATGYTTLNIVSSGSEANFIAPSDSAYLYVYGGGIPTLGRIPAAVYVNGYNRVEKLCDNFNNEIEKIRLMQYNVGHFNMGQSLSGDAQYLTTDNVNAKVSAYKNLLGKYQPDIAGFEEFNDERDVYSDGSVAETISFDNLVFNRIFPYAYTYAGLASAPAIKSKFPIMSMERLNYEYTYEVDGVSSTANQRALLAHIDVNGKELVVLNCAYPSGVSEELTARRAGSISAAIALLEDYDYTVIICDENNTGVASSTTIDNSAAESTAILNNVLIPNGWTNCMGSYFDFEQTWESTNTQYVSTVDNILYKNNGKIRVSGIEVLNELYVDLISDHYPFLADIILE